MFKRFLNFLFGKKEVPTVAVELNAIEVSSPETVKIPDDVYFPVTALADTTPVVAEVEKPKKARKPRGPRKPKTVATETVAVDAETAEAKPKKRRYYKPRKKKTDTGSASSPEKSL
jgi:hypothetical protein